VEMVALIQEYPTYKGTFHLRVTLPVKFSFWPNTNRGFLAAPEKRGSESHSMPWKRSHGYISSVKYQTWRDAGGHCWWLKTVCEQKWKMQWNVMTRESQG